MKDHRAESWAVYRRPVRNRSRLLNAVCEGCKWDAMEAARPGYTLVRSGTASEGDAETLARSAPTAGAPPTVVAAD